MKADIHPKVNTNCKVTCACGNTFVTESTKDTISVDICSNCHPFYTGKQKFVDTEGRIDKFEKKRASFLEKNTSKQAKDNKAKAAVEPKSEKKLTLKEMMEQAKSQGK